MAPEKRKMKTFLITSYHGFAFFKILGKSVSVITAVNK